MFIIVDVCVIGLVQCLGAAYKWDVERESALDRLKY